MERTTESAGITTVFREHYKQLGSPMRRVQTRQLRPRDIASAGLGRQSTKRRYTNPTEGNLRSCDLLTYKAGDAAGPKVS
jgi:hypothetical protein